MILDLNIIDYEAGLKIQREFVAKRRCGEIDDSVLLAEHPAVFTIGRSGSRKNLLIDENLLSGKGVKVLEVDRAGDITFHGLGQLVVYPIVDLRPRGKDLHDYLRALEEVAIHFLKNYGVTGERIKGATGVWVDAEKIASIGIAARDWITYHGISININTDLSFFSMIKVCGMDNIKVTSLKDIYKKKFSMREAKKIFQDSFEAVFGIEKTGTFQDEYCSAVA